MIDRTLQSYLKDAIRNVDIKIFKAEVTHGTKKSVYYFTNRFEIGYANHKGNASVYDKLEQLRNIVNASNLPACEEAYETQKA